MLNLSPVAKNGFESINRYQTPIADWSKYGIEMMDKTLEKIEYYESNMLLPKITEENEAETPEKHISINASNRSGPKLSKIKSQHRLQPYIQNARGSVDSAGTDIFLKK